MERHPHHHHNHDHDHHDHGHGQHEHTLYGELMCHLPHAIFAVAVALSILSFVTYFSLGSVNDPVLKKGARMLFHSFHFMHILFAATGTLITFLRFSRSVPRALFVGIVAPSFFCVLSDIVLPYIGGRLLGVQMHLHLCFFNEYANVIPFLFAGIINGFVLSRHHADLQSSFSRFSHAIHIFMSSLASTFYLVSHGFAYWHKHIGMVFVFLVIAVVIPCTLSDVVVPMAFAKGGKKQ